MVACVVFTIETKTRVVAFRVHLSFGTRRELPPDKALDQIHFLCFAFCGPRELNFTALSPCQSIMHFFFDDELTHGQLLAFEREHGEMKSLGPPAKKGLPKHGGWPTPGAQSGDPSSPV